MEPPASYVKGIVALLVLTEIFRLSDATLNWSFLSTQQGFATFFRFDLVFIVSGVVLVALSLSNARFGIAAGFCYSIAGILLTLFDPDFPGFVVNPLGYFTGMDIVVSLLFSLGTLVLAVMLIVAMRGLASLKLGAKQFE